MCVWLCVVTFTWLAVPSLACMYAYWLLIYTDAKSTCISASCVAAAERQTASHHGGQRTRLQRTGGQNSKPLQAVVAISNADEFSLLVFIEESFHFVVDTLIGVGTIIDLCNEMEWRVGMLWRVTKENYRPSVPVIKTRRLTIELTRKRKTIEHHIIVVTVSRITHGGQLW